MSKILVTGGAGFVGTNLIIELQKLGHNLTSIDNYSIGTEENHQRGVEYINGDVTRINELKENDFDLCYHLAGLSRIQPSFLQVEETFNTNTFGTLKVLDWARKNKTKVIYSGSSSKHHDPTISPYAMFKYLGEEICKLYKVTFDINVEIVRFYNVYGPYEITDGKWAALIGKWRGQIKDGKPLTIVGNGNQKRDFTHIIDIVDGLIKIGLSNYSCENGWELGSGKNYSINEVFQMFEHVFSVNSEHTKNQKGNYRETLRESNEALDRLGWEPKDRLFDYIKNLKND
jgi:UDP-glucose 4-epimerase